MATIMVIVGVLAKIMTMLNDDDAGMGGNTYGE
jgi:hypothetical protein